MTSFMLIKVFSVLSMFLKLSTLSPSSLLRCVREGGGEEQQASCLVAKWRRRGGGGGGGGAIGFL